MILCITHSQDYYTIDLFFQYLKSLQISFFRLNTDLMNHEMKISLSEKSFEITDESGKKISSENIKAVWHRKSWQISSPKDLDDDYKNIFFAEYRSLQTNLFTILKNIPWINNFEAERKVESNKMLQLETAKESGLLIPKTIFSNDKDAVLAFFKANDQKTIAKLHGAISKSMDGKNMVSTMFLDENNLEELSNLEFCPMIFQNYIEKEYELRIVYINGTFFTGKINNNKHTDWRISQSGFFWEKYELPVVIRQNLSSMMNEMGLVFGAIDMIKSTDGNYYFMEVNPQGEWGMLQKDLGFPIAENIADYLIKSIKTNEQ